MLDLNRVAEEAELHHLVAVTVLLKMDGAAARLGLRRCYDILIEAGASHDEALEFLDDTDFRRPG